jgi:hypothetical protein
MRLMEIGAWSVLKGGLNIFLMVFVMACVAALLFQAAARCLAVLRGMVPVQPDEWRLEGVRLANGGTAPVSVVKPEQ